MSRADDERGAALIDAEFDQADDAPIDPFAEMGMGIGNQPLRWIDLLAYVAEGECFRCLACGALFDPTVAGQVLAHQFRPTFSWPPFGPPRCVPDAQGGRT